MEKLFNRTEFLCGPNECSGSNIKTRVCLQMLKLLLDAGSGSVQHMT